MTYFYSSGSILDYGTKIRIKCDQPLTRTDQTLDGEKCVNWRTVDSFGVEIAADYGTSADVTSTEYDWSDGMIGLRYAWSPYDFDRFYHPMDGYYGLTSGSGLERMKCLC